VRQIDLRNFRKKSPKYEVTGGSENVNPRISQPFPNRFWWNLAVFYTCPISPDHSYRFRKSGPGAEINEKNLKMYHFTGFYRQLKN